MREGERNEKGGVFPREDFLFLNFRLSVSVIAVAAGLIFIKYLGSPRVILLLNSVLRPSPFCLCALLLCFFV